MRNRDVDLDRLDEETASQYARRMRSHFARKADHNKAESLAGFLFVILGTLAVSGFVAFGTGEFLAKIIPVCLSLLVTAASTWLHFRRPHQLWAVYRSAQRYIENHQVKHRFDVDEYERATDKDRVLARSVAAIALSAHELWVPLVPSPEGLEQLRSPSPSLVPHPASPEPRAGASGGQIDGEDRG
jgi:hypothetical protein